MNERILIIEDDQQILKLLQRGLSYEGYTVDTATDGRMGLILARDHTPDLVVLDWMLPGMDGLEVCHRLRTGGSIPVVASFGARSIPSVVTGVARPSAQVHSPNENIPAESLREGVAVVVETLRRFGDLG